MTALLLSLLFLACSSSEEAATPPPTPTAAEPAPVAEAPAVPPGPRVPPITDQRFAARHILVSWAGAVNALPNVQRTREEARIRAEEARQKVLDGADFAQVARAWSDDSTAARGGDLGGFEAGTMVAPFEEAVRALKVGEVSRVIETPFGFHVIERLPLREVRCAHLIVSWKGAERAPPGVTRSRAEAKARAEEAVAKAAAGEPWDNLVATYSDGPMKDEGGDLGWFGPGQLAAPLDAAAFDLDIGQVSAVVETARGYHVLKRLE